MSGPAPFIDFFILEAGDYVEQLDGLLLGAGQVGPDAELMQKLARALRGSATMAKLRSFADVAGGVERMARAMGDGSIHWDPGIGATLVAAVDDLKILVRSARTWSVADDDRARSRAMDLARHAPASLASAPTPVVASGLAFFGGEAMNIAAGIELLVTRPDDRESAIQVLKRVRALRGVAGVKDVVGLADVLDATDEATRTLEREGQGLSEASSRVLRAAVPLLRRIADELRDGRTPEAAAMERTVFADAVDLWFAGDLASARVVPVSDFFYDDDGPHVVSAAPNPPTSAHERFRLELVSFGEHLRGLLGAARAHGGTWPPAARRAMARTFAGIANVAQSFGDTESAEIVDEVAKQSAAADYSNFSTLEAVAQAIGDQSMNASNLKSRLSRAAGRQTMATPAAPRQTIARQPEAAPTLPPVPMIDKIIEREPVRPAAERGEEPLRSSDGQVVDVDAGIAAIARFTAQPLFAQTPVPEIEIVPIESLLYKGRAALERAIEIRDGVRTHGGAPDAEALEELFDLLDLARAE